MLSRFGLFSRRAIPSTSSVVTRGLHKLDPKWGEVVIGNNAALFATLFALQEHGRALHPNLTIFYPNFWMDLVLECNNHRQWGQTIFGLPKFIRNIFRRLYPAHPIDQYITWEQMQGLRYEVIDRLQEEMNVPFIYGEPEFEVLPSGKHIMHALDGGVTRSIPMNNKTHYYNWYRRHRAHSFGEDIAQVGQHALYSSAYADSKNVPKNIILYGTGLSVAWAERDFPNSNIYSLRSDPQYTVPRIPANEGQVNFDRIHYIEKHEATVLSEAQGTNLVSVSGGGLSQTIQGGLFLAAGFDPVRVTGVLSSDNTLRDDRATYLPESEKSSKFVGTLNEPTNGLMDSFVTWLELTNNLQIGLEPLHFHRKVGDEWYDYIPESLPDILIREAKKVDIELTIAYFDELEVEIKKMANPCDELSNWHLHLEIFRRRISSNHLVLARFQAMLEQLSGVDLTQEPSQRFSP